MDNSYRATEQFRVEITQPNTWVRFSLPIGVRFPLIGIENPEYSFRISTDNTLDPTTQGVYIPPAGSYQYEGISTNTMSLYVSSPVATNLIIIYTVD